MQCNQLTRLIKGWFLHVKDETMAPARMMQFVDQQISTSRNAKCAGKTRTCTRR